MEPAPRAASNAGQAAGFVVTPVPESANPRVSTRTDTKASLLLAFDGAVLAGLASIADAKLPVPAQIAGGAAALALAAAAVLLLLVVRPNLGGRGRVVLSTLRQDTRPTRVRALSALAVAKFRRLARAVDTILGALALLLLAAVLAVTG
ncbi:integral membrane plasmid transfer protein [Streptomyces sp. NPDC050600]|uniref:integral membrane plasmid transfer protein n=1 Tax=Streptomyces sp. NPDC050600 TaxID=3157213 RepID=UPI0034300363